MAWATDENLVDYIPDIFDHGESSFDTELLRSEDDVVRKIKGDWWNVSHTPSDFDKTKLVEGEWTRAVVYHALAYYILPKLANFGDEDTFLAMRDFYESRYAEEMDEVFAAGVSYDFDGDSVINEETEVRRTTQTRLVR